jgi:aminoglycoside phosphotransferase family enzyme/predicted kinase
VSEAGDGGTPAPARVVETHISILVFIGDRVYKLRKPVRYDFVDFTERDVRRADCAREVELNRRLAPDVYLGVADVVMDGQPLEHLVVMRALPEERRLATVVQTGDPGSVASALDAVAVVVARFHASAHRSAAIATRATPDVLASEWSANFAETERFVGPLLDPVAEDEIHVSVERWLVQHGALLDARIAGGWICDGHGDLQAEDVFCLDDGVRILDCIEFDDALRYGDVAADVAFLAMDLERLGHREAAARFVSAYERESGASIPPALLHFYVAQRAYVRAKVACLAHEQGATGADRSARALQDLALSHLRRARPVLLLVGGLPGTGKSTLAAAAAAEGWEVLRTDQVRRDLPERSGEDRYAPPAIADAYREMLERARRVLAGGSSAVLDATWAAAEERARAARLAAEAGASLVEVRCTCDDDVAAARIEERRRRATDASEATVAVRRAMEARFDPWPAAAVVDTSRESPEALAGQVRAVVEARAAGSSGPS